MVSFWAFYFSPIPDPTRQYGNPNCEECRGHCSGHFMKPKDALMSSLQPIRPPSAILKEEFDGMSSYPPSESVCADLSMKVMLPVEEIKIWLDHLHTIRENRKKGALKAAETRRRNKNYFCNCQH